MKKDENNTLAARTKLAMSEAQVTQKALAEKIGVKQQTIQKICSGIIKRSKYLHEIAQELDVNVHWLLNGTSSKKEQGRVVKPSNTLFVPLLEAREILQWDKLKEDENFCQTKTLLPVLPTLNPDSFGFKVLGDSMSSQHKHSIPDEAIVIVDPAGEVKHDNFVLVYLHELNDVVVRQISIEGTRKYLKVLNEKYPDPILPLQAKDKVLGVICLTFQMLIPIN